MKHLIFLFLISSTLIVSCSSSKDKDIDDVEDIIEETEEIPEIVEDVVEIEDTEEAQNITWKNWYLSVPLDRGNGKATSIYFETIEKDALTTSESQYFSKNDDGSYTMFTKFTGYTTSGEAELNAGKYCRTELREYWQGNQTTDDNWSMNTGTHILESTLKVDFVEGNGRTIVAQIHGIETDGLEGSPATVKIRWNDGQIQLDYYTKPDSGEPWTSTFDEKLDVGFVGNDIFTFKIKIEDGKFYYGLVCDSKDINTDYTFVFDYVGNGYAYNNYFKTGNYFGWNADYEKTAQVVLYEVKTKHL